MSHHTLVQSGLGRTLIGINLLHGTTRLMINVETTTTVGGQPEVSTSTDRTAVALAVLATMTIGIVPTIVMTPSTSHPVTTSPHLRHPHLVRMVRLYGQVASAIIG